MQVATLWFIFLKSTKSCYILYTNNHNQRRDTGSMIHTNNKHRRTVDKDTKQF